MYGYWPRYLTTLIHRAFVFAFPGRVVAVCRPQAPLVNLAHSLLPDLSGGLRCQGTIPDVFIILLLELASSAYACRVQVGLASLHGVQSGQHSMQLFDVMCALVRVLAVAVESEDCMPVVDIGQGRRPFHVVDIRYCSLDPSLRCPGLMVTDCCLLFEELS